MEASKIRPNGRPTAFRPPILGKRTVAGLNALRNVGLCNIQGGSDHRHTINQAQERDKNLTIRKPPLTNHPLRVILIKLKGRDWVEEYYMINESEIYQILF